jgi:hypothetical protein
MRNNNDETTRNSQTSISNVAGDWLTGPEIAKAFEHAQNSNYRYFQNRKLTRMARRNFRKLYEEIRFLQTSKEQTDIEGLWEQFQPGLVIFRSFWRKPDGETAIAPLTTFPIQTH